MRSWFPVAVVCALAVAAFAGQDLAAKCRCNVSARRAAKIERKAARRGGYQYQYVTPDSNYRPDDGGVQPLGAAAATPVETELVWQCHGGRCRLVRVPVTRQAQPIPAKPVPDPAFKATIPAAQPPPVEAKKEAALVIPPPAPNALAGSDIPQF